MKITLEIAPSVEDELRASVARRDRDAAQKLLAEAVAPAVEALLKETGAELTEIEFEAVADQVAEELRTALGSNAPSLSDYAVSRDSIYGDHP